MTIEEEMKAAAAAVGLSITRYNDEIAAVTGTRETFVASHGEVLAYLAGYKAHAIDHPPPLVPSRNGSILAFRSRGAIFSTETVWICCPPQRAPFRGHRLAIPHDIAPYFELLDLKVGNISQFLNGAGMDAGVFSTRIDKQARFRTATPGGDLMRVEMSEGGLEEFGHALAMEACPVGMDISLILRRKEEDLSGQGIAFEAYVFGTEAR